MCPSVCLIVHLSAWAFTNSLAQKLSRNFSFYGFAAGQNGFTSTRILTPKQSIILTKTLTLTRALNNRIHVLLAWHVTKTIFLPITLQGSILSYVMWGDSESASKITPNIWHFSDGHLKKIKSKQ